MRLCRRAVDFVQITNADGEVRLCSWQKDGGVIGYLTRNTLEEIYHSDEAKLIQDMHVKKDYSNCNPNTCPYVANDTVDSVSVDIDEIPKYPTAIYLAYENVCNYRCIMCGIPSCMIKEDKKVLEKKYDRIDRELIKILPYVKRLSANGLGELFVSKHTLKLLSEWKPIAPPEEIFVTLETNGSLFDADHWKQIENLGQYNLSVAITVLSFDDETYRRLSGTAQSVQKLEDNLRFVKSLRENNIINKLEIATVYQADNFRELPEFARRCIDEFGADSVRLRPFEPWGEAGMKEWLMDVRNVYHPLHEDFLQVMSNPILKNSKVHDWGGGKESGLGPEPYKRLRENYHIMEKIFSDEFLDKIKEMDVKEKIVVYGMTVVGKALISRLQINYEIPYCLDRKMDGIYYGSIPLYGINNFANLDKEVTVIIALNWSEDMIENMLRRSGYTSILRIAGLVQE